MLTLTQVYHVRYCCLPRLQDVCEAQSVQELLYEPTWVMLFLALLRDILRPALCEHELQDEEFPLPLVTKLPMPAGMFQPLLPDPSRS